MKIKVKYSANLMSPKAPHIVVKSEGQQTNGSDYIRPPFKGKLYLGVGL